MRPDSMLVENDHLVQAQSQLAEVDTGEAVKRFSESEPVLASYLFNNLAIIAGKQALSGVPTPVVQGSYEDTVTLVLTCLEALRRGHYDLWKDTWTGRRSRRDSGKFTSSFKKNEKEEQAGQDQQ